MQESSIECHILQALKQNEKPLTLQEIAEKVGPHLRVPQWDEPIVYVPQVDPEDMQRRRARSVVQDLLRANAIERCGRDPETHARRYRIRS